MFELKEETLENNRYSALWYTFQPCSRVHLCAAEHDSSLRQTTARSRRIATFRHGYLVDVVASNGEYQHKSGCAITPDDVRAEQAHWRQYDMIFERPAAKKHFTELFADDYALAHRSTMRLLAAEHNAVQQYECVLRHEHDMSLCDRVYAKLRDDTLSRKLTIGDGAKFALYARNKLKGWGNTDDARQVEEHIKRSLGLYGRVLLLR